MTKRKITLENKSYKNQKVCYIWKKGFIDNNKKYKVIDHCHFTGKYRGATRNICNLRYKVPKKIQLFFIMVRIMTIILLLKNYLKNLKDNLNA